MNQVGELIFTDSTELMREFGISDPNGHTYKGLHTQIVDFVNYQIEDLYRRDLIANIFITGGLTSTTGTIFMFRLTVSSHLIYCLYMP